LIASRGERQQDQERGSRTHTTAQGRATDGPLIHAPADVPSNRRWSSVGSQSLPVEEVKETRTTKSVGNSTGSRALSRHVDSNHCGGTCRVPSRTLLRRPCSSSICTW